MYRSLRSDKKLTYEKIIEYFVKNGSDKWSESIYNEDADYKYISMLRSDNDATNLYQVKGKGEEHLEYFASNRLKYYDSKCYAADYADNYVALRIYTPTEWSGVAPNANITITPFSNMYAGVRYKANGTLYQKRVAKNEIAAFSPQGENFEAERNETFNDTETAIYGASEISSLGDLAPLYCGSINVSKASRLINLKVGDATEGYQNNNLTELSVGTNKLLKVVDVRNCPKLTDPLVLTGCPNIEEIYAAGSGITGVELAKSGYLKKIHLPATITNLTLQNQIYINDFKIDGYDNISSLNIANCPTIDEYDIFTKCVNLRRVRLTDIDWSIESADFLVSLANSGLGGIDENGLNVDVPQISGKCHIESLTGADMLQIKAYYPYLNITYTTLTATVTFMNGDTVVGTAVAHNGGGVAYGGEALTKESTAQYHFDHIGWSLTPDGEADASLLENVTTDMTVYAVFAEELRHYNVYFYNGTELHETVENVPYGGSVIPLADDPVNNSTGNPDDFKFIGWNPKPENITGDTYCYAQYEDNRMIEDSWATVVANANNGTATSLYGLGAPKTLDLGAVELPYNFAGCSVAVLNGEIHIIGNDSSVYCKYHYKWNGTEWVSVSTLPYGFKSGSVVVLNDEIHIIGGGSSGSTRTSHYKWNGTEWVSVSTLPYTFYYGSTVVYNDEIHIIGGSSSSTNHYKWNGTEWVSVSTLPYTFNQGSAVVLNNEIHILGSNVSSYYKSHYVWKGTEWESVSTLPYDFNQGSAVIYNDEIHILGSYNDLYSTKHYKWDGTSWESVSTLPHQHGMGSAVICNNEIHIMGSRAVSYRTKHYKWNGSEWKHNGVTESVTMQVASHNQDAYPDGVGKWSSLGRVKWSFYNGSAVVYNDEIHIFGGTSDPEYHVKWNGVEWIREEDLPYDFVVGSAVVLNAEIHILGGNNNGKKHYKWNGTEWVSVSTLPYDAVTCKVVVYNNEIHIFGGNIGSTNHYKWNGTEWVSVSTLPYDFVVGSAVVLNAEIHILGGNNNGKKHYKWNGTEWISVSTLPYNFYLGSAVVLNNEIHIMGSVDNTTNHYKWNGAEWISASTLPYDFRNSCSVVYDGKIHIMGSYSSQYSFYSFSTDNLTATLTFVGKFLLKDKRPLTSMREYLNGDFISLLPSDLQTALTTVKKLSNGEVSNDKVWLLSAEEVADGNVIYPAIFKDKGSRIKTTMDGTPSKWWLRSGELVDENGAIITADDQTEAQGVLIGFCIG